MQSTRHLGAPLLFLLAALISLSCQARNSGQSTATSSHSIADSLARAASVERGHESYLTYCAMCHGDGGNGDGEVAAALRVKSNTVVARLNDRELMDRLSRDDIMAVIEKGGAHTGRSNMMPAWGEKLDHATIEDITDFVMSLAGSNPAIPNTTIQHYLQAPPGVPADGRVLFVHHCVACHGPDAKGDGPYAARIWSTDHIRPRDLTDSTYLATRTDRDLFAVISLGGGHLGKSTKMPAWTVTLTPAQIQSLVAYVREVSRTTAPH